MIMDLAQGVLLVILVLSGIVALAVRDLMASVIVFGLFSFFAALLYTFMGALDVAFTEAVVGAVTTVFYITVFFRTNRRASP